MTDFSQVSKSKNEAQLYIRATERAVEATSGTPRISLPNKNISDAVQPFDDRILREQAFLFLNIHVLILKHFTNQSFKKGKSTSFQSFVNQNHMLGVRKNSLSVNLFFSLIKGNKSSATTSFSGGSFFLTRQYSLKK